MEERRDDVFPRGWLRRKPLVSGVIRQQLVAHLRKPKIQPVPHWQDVKYLWGNEEAQLLQRLATSFSPHARGQVPTLSREPDPDKPPRS